MTPANPLGAEIVALYRHARSDHLGDFKMRGLERTSAFLRLTSASWINGVLLGGVPVVNDASDVGGLPGFAQSIASLGPAI